MHGQGVETYWGANNYTGEFKNGKPDGEGILKYPKNVYKGSFKAGERHGLGSLTWPDGRVFKGQWDGDMWIHEVNNPFLYILILS